jgi:hypothetical protein
MSEQIVEALENYRKMTERMAEETFHRIYGSPILQAALGVDTDSDERPRKAAKSLLHRELIEKRTAELKADFAKGGLREACVRALIYVGAGRGSIDERGFEAIKRLRRTNLFGARLSLPEFKMLVREQSYILWIDEEAALATISGLLPEELDQRQAGFDVLRDVLEARGALDAEAAQRLARIAELFDLESPPAAIVPPRALETPLAAVTPAREKVRSDAAKTVPKGATRPRARRQP